MLTARLSGRVPSARNSRVVPLPGHIVRYRKRSVDGSAKCDLMQDRASTAYGVVFDIDPEEKRNLDKAEGAGCGYHQEQLTVVVDGHELRPFVYLAEASHIDEGKQPYDWYRDQVVRGALEHHLPSAYVREQLDVPVARDPDEARNRRERAVLGEEEPGCDV